MRYKRLPQGSFVSVNPSWPSQKIQYRLFFLTSCQMLLDLMKNK
uniref:Uncharacterized protein n=1 Tax=Rhizophora mucronata TaxID=61149 RepID=A0A2P2J2Z3_RHIMU